MLLENIYGKVVTHDKLSRDNRNMFIVTATGFESNKIDKLLIKARASSYCMLKEDKNRKKSIDFDSFSDQYCSNCANID
jgi:hypothetical protein